MKSNYTVSAFLFMVGMTVSIITPHSFALENGLGRVPPMGWNNFNWFGNDPKESITKQVTDAMVKCGLRDLGYTYVNIDDAWWQSSRDGSGNLKVVSSAFPNGIKTVADYIHGKNMKFGVYLVAGASSWGNGVGSEGHETADAKWIADQGVDFLKYEYMYSGTVHAASGNQQTTMTAMSNAIKACGRPIYLSINTAGGSNPWDFGQTTVNQWRVCTDVKDQWDGDFNGGFGFNKVVENAVTHWSSAGPGHWNDPDMLIVGIHGKNSTWMGPGCTSEEYRSHFDLWCLLAAPLLIGWDPRVIADFNGFKNQYSNPPTLAQFQYDSTTLFNKEMIAINQDSLGAQGQRVKSSGSIDVWAKPLRNGDIAVGLYNRTNATTNITVSFSNLTNLSYFGKNYGISATAARKVRDLWKHEDLGTFTGSYTMNNIPKHEMGVVLLTDPSVGINRLDIVAKKKFEGIKNGCITVPQGVHYAVSVTDVSGKLLFSQKAKEGTINFEKGLRKGIYLLQVNAKGELYNQKIRIY